MGRYALYLLSHISCLLLSCMKNFAEEVSWAKSKWVLMSFAANDSIFVQRNGQSHFE